MPSGVGAGCTIGCAGGDAGGGAGWVAAVGSELGVAWLGGGVGAIGGVVGCPGGGVGTPGSVGVVIISTLVGAHRWDDAEHARTHQPSARRSIVASSRHSVEPVAIFSKRAVVSAALSLGHTSSHNIAHRNLSSSETSLQAIVVVYTQATLPALATDWDGEWHPREISLWITFENPVALRPLSHPIW